MVNKKIIIRKDVIMSGKGIYLSNNEMRYMNIRDSIQNNKQGSHFE